MYKTNHDVHYNDIDVDFMMAQCRIGRGLGGEGEREGAAAGAEVLRSWTAFIMKNTMLVTKIE